MHWKYAGKGDLETLTCSQILDQLGAGKIYLQPMRREYANDVTYIQASYHRAGLPFWVYETQIW